MDTTSPEKKELDQLGLVMFRTFARFEYALKATGFHFGDGPATANWTTFAASIDEAFDAAADPHLTAARQYLLDQPPRRQIVRNGLLEWDDVAPNFESRTDLVLQYVRRVRNNLFHGGKFNSDRIEPERNRQLLKSSLLILDACLSLSHRVRQMFQEP